MRCIRKLLALVPRGMAARRTRVAAPTPRQRGERKPGGRTRPASPEVEPPSGRRTGGHSTTPKPGRAIPRGLPPCARFMPREHLVLLVLSCGDVRTFMRYLGPPRRFCQAQRTAVRGLWKCEREPGPHRPGRGTAGTGAMAAINPSRPVSRRPTGQEDSRVVAQPPRHTRAYGAACLDAGTSDAGSPRYGGRSWTRTRWRSWPSRPSSGK